MTWESIAWHTGEHGSIFVSKGKTAGARRSIPMSQRLRFVLEHRWEQDGAPEQGWIWPSATKSGHFEQSTIKKRHRSILGLCAKSISKKGPLGSVPASQLKPVRSFVLYSLRHTFLTRLGESGCDAWTLAKIAGHSNIAMSQRYVHPSQEAVARAMTRLSGHIFGHNDELNNALTESKRLESVDTTGVAWCTRQDSNLRPNASEAFALSI